MGDGRGDGRGTGDPEQGERGEGERLIHGLRRPGIQGRGRGGVRDSLGIPGTGPQGRRKWELGNAPGTPGNGSVVPLAPAWCMATECLISAQVSIGAQQPSEAQGPKGGGASRGEASN